MPGQKMLPKLTPSAMTFEGENLPKKLRLQLGGNCILLWWFGSFCI